jgi:putative transcriptional regulator
MDNLIRELRKSRNLSQEDVARLCNVSRQTIISLESGKYNPSIFLAHNIAKLFSKSIEELFIFEEEL